MCSGQRTADAERQHARVKRVAAALRDLRVAARRPAQAEMADAVLAARAFGAEWAEIGRTLGLPAWQVREKYDR